MNMLMRSRCTLMVFLLIAPVAAAQEKGTTFTIELPAIETLNCQASIAIDYTQNDTVARVDGTLENKTCAASSGSYVISVSTIDANNKLQTQQFTETWQRDDDQPVKFGKDYPIGSNVDLVRVQTPRVQCKCAVPPEVAPPEATEPDVAQPTASDK